MLKLAAQGWDVGKNSWSFTIYTDQQLHPNTGWGCTFSKFKFTGRHPKGYYNTALNGHSTV